MVANVSCGLVILQNARLGYSEADTGEGVEVGKRWGVIWWKWDSWLERMGWNTGL